MFSHPKVPAAMVSLAVVQSNAFIELAMVLAFCPPVSQVPLGCDGKGSGKFGLHR
ncbi:MAG: hypothetical protein LBB38_02725 [Puniceicoccales bacterium]|nr:hypothetical protein [Puniceicoccales bacterium]